MLGLKAARGGTEVKAARAYVLVTLLVLSVPAASADSLFTASVIEFAGASSTDGPGHVLFAMSGERGLDWDIVAASAVVDRKFAESWTLDARPGYQHLGSPQYERIDFGPSRIESGLTDLAGAILIEPLGGVFDIETAGRGLVARTQLDPALDQGPPAEISGESTNYSIHRAFTGEFLNLSLTDADIVIRGDLVITLFGVDHTVESGGVRTAFQTGEETEERVGPTPDIAIVVGRIERNIITLHDAVIRIHAPERAILLADEQSARLTGELRVTAGEGDIGVEGMNLLRGSGGNRVLQGIAAMALAADAGRVSITPAPQAETAAARVAAPALSTAWGIAALLVLAAGAVIGVIVWRRRAQADDLEMALLAMDDHRWGDAVPRLDRAIAKQPDDANLHVDRALCLAEVGRLNEARAGYERALELAPRNAEAHYYYARVLARLELSTPCLTHLTRALALDARLGELARSEAAFRAYRDHPRFAGLVG